MVHHLLLAALSDITALSSRASTVALMTAANRVVHRFEHLLGDAVAFLRSLLRQIILHFGGEVSIGVHRFVSFRLAHSAELVDVNAAAVGRVEIFPHFVHVFAADLNS